LVVGRIVRGAVILTFVVFIVPVSGVARLVQSGKVLKPGEYPVRGFDRF
jgi:hypothetical protein